MKEYIVALHKDVDYDQFWNEIETNTNNLEFVPNRPVEIVNNRDGSLRSCHYALTDNEAEKLRNDPRVYCVEIPPDQRSDIQITKTVLNQLGDFTKPSVSTGKQINWGLVRLSSNTNVYGSNVYPASNVYYYDFDGLGVDVVIQDSGIEEGHPEFQDIDGNNRVQKINWYTESGLSGTQSPNHYRDYDGHGTHVAGIVAGKTFGWAKNAKIYSLKINGLEGSGDGGTGIPISDCFDVIKLWHQNKPVNPETGFKRPTIINASWGYTANIWNNISSMTYRGTSYTGDDISGYINKWYKGLTPIGVTNNDATDMDNYTINVRVPSVDVDVQELLDAGVHFIHSAGNNYTKADVPGGLDYDNYLQITGGSTYYYNRGSSPLATGAVMVGAIDKNTQGTLDRKVDFSNTGEVYAPGVSIRSCTSNTNRFGGVSYAFGHTGYKQVNLSGTSQASPQVAGIGAVYLQKYPGATVSELKNWLGNAGSVLNIIYNTGLDYDYYSLNSLMGSPNKMAYSYVYADPPQTFLEINLGGDFLKLENVSISYT